MTQSKVTSSALLQYSMLAAPVAFAGFPLYVLAPDFYATEHGISLATLGFALLGLRLFDALQDPLIGFLSDRYRQYTSLIMVIAAAILCASVYGLFTHNYVAPLVWFICCIGLAVTAYSVLSINLNALGALWTKDSNLQTKISTTREAFGLLGLVIAVTLPGVLAKIVPQEQVYQWFGLTLAVVMGVAVWCFLRWYQSEPQNSEHARAIGCSFLANMKTLSSASKKLLVVYLVSMIASSIPAVLVIFFVRDLLGAQHYAGVFLLLYFLSGACFMPLWRRISLRYGKYTTWLCSMMLAVASFVWAFTLTQGDIWQYAIICIVSGMALGADLMFPPAILADQLHSNQSEGSASTHYALLALVAKAALAFASAIALPLLESAGFSPNAENSASALKALSAAYALMPCLLKLVAAFLLWLMFIYSNKGAIHGNNQINSITGSSYHV